MQIRRETAGDRLLIGEMVTAAFGRRHEADLVDRLREGGDAEISLVADDQGEIAGHVLLSRLSAPFRALALAPVSVAPRRQRSGIGSRLIRAGLGEARREGWQGVFVLGEPSYYRRFGFDPALARGFLSPYAGPHLMALALDAALPVRSGEIEYPQAFEEMD